VGCTPEIIEVNCRPPQNSPSSPSTPTELREVRIGVDGSLSMLGYVKPGQTNYTRALDAVRSAASSGFNGVKLSYVRVGLLPSLPGSSSIQDIDSGEYLQAKSAEFYSVGNRLFPNVTSNLKAFFETHNEDQFSIFLTDLQPNASDVTSMTRSLQKFFSSSPDFAFGVVGVRSQFDDRVYYEEGGALSSFTYKTQPNGDVSTFRPVYILFLGTFEVVLEQIQDTLSFLDPQEKFTEVSIFSSSDTIQSVGMVDTNISLDLGQVSRGRITDVPTLQVGTLRVVSTSNDYRLLLARTDWQDSVSINETVSGFQQGTYTLIPDWKKITFETTDANGKVLPVSTVINQELLMEQTDNLRFQAQLDPSALEPGEIQFVKVQASLGGFVEPEWWQMWDWSTREKREENDTQDGSKTYNLLLFLREMSLTQFKQMPEEQRVVGNFCFAIGRQQ